MKSYCVKDIAISNDIEKEKVYQSIKMYEYALVYMLSEVILCKTEDLPKLNLEQCLEARFFSEDKELHIFETEEGKKAVEVSDKNNEDIIIKKYEIAPKFCESKKKQVLVVQQYLDYDKDGQAVVGLTRLKGIE